MNVQLSMEETYAEIAPVRPASNGVTAFLSIMRGCNNMCRCACVHGCIHSFSQVACRSRRLSPSALVTLCVNLCPLFLSLHACLSVNEHDAATIVLASPRVIVSERMFGTMHAPWHLCACVRMRERGRELLCVCCCTCLPVPLHVHMCLCVCMPVCLLLQLLRGSLHARARAISRYDVDSR